MKVVNKTTLGRNHHTSEPVLKADHIAKCVASTIALSNREIEILRPAHLEPIAWQDETLADTLIALGATVLIADSFPSNDILTKWRDNIAGSLIVAVLQPSDVAAELYSPSLIHDNLACCYFDRQAISLQKALSDAEHVRTFGVEILPAPMTHSTESPAGKSVAVLGAGIVSLIAAFEFAKAGYAVDVFEKSPDPRSRPDWTHPGCTHGGEGVRMFSLTECDSYHDRSCENGPKLHRFIDTALDHMGWGLGEEDRFDVEELTWKSEFRDVPIFLADHYNEDIFALNHESYRIWRDTINKEPALFEGVMLTEGLLRICRTEAYLAHA